MRLARYIDHTNLKPEASAEDIKKLCDEARRCGFASVCVNSSRAALASECLKGSGVAVCAVVGFPLGAACGEAKAFEAAAAAHSGASEIDMAINVGLIKDGGVVKVIIECCLLSDGEKRRACRAAMRGGAHFVKTSTGFSSGGATVADVKLMRQAVGDKMRIKAAGGIRSAKFARELIAAGADRIGASKSIDICAEERAE